MTLRAKQVRSAGRPAWSGRSHVSTFIRCLHLLDLNLLEDWPGIDEATFTATATIAKANQLNKLRATEWALYRLFELYNAELTKDKLQPFFPPSSPLQSVNLRAALYRCLSELKKNGVLGAQLQLRKTMLDECRGDKFEELIAGFASIVLRQESQQRYATVLENHDRVDSDQLLPLVLAHRKSLSSKLAQRKLAEQDLQVTLERVEQANEVLMRRRNLLEEKTTKPDPSLQQQMQNLVRTNWIGDHTWATLLLKGLPAKPALQHVPSEGLVEESRNAAESSVEILVNNINASINTHRHRLAEWKLIAKDLRTEQSRGNQPERTGQVRPGANRSGKFHFSQHKEMDAKVKSIDSVPILIPDQDFQALLDHMQDEMKLSRPETYGQYARGSQLAYNSPRNPNILHTPLSKRKSLEINATVPSYSHKFKSAGSISPDSSPVSTLPDEESTVPWSKDQRYSPTTADLITPTKVSESVPPTDLPAKDLYELPTSPSKEWMSLMDRTRASMSGFGTYNQPKSSSHIEHDVEQPEIQEVKTPQREDQGRRITLVERTRQSMSLFSASAATKQSQHINRRKSQRLSQMFPINQFETPGRPRPRISEFGPSSDSSTPRDKLFEEAADYESVFKSRPRIAMSPSMSPDRSHVGFDSILEDDLEGLQLASDDEYD